MGSEEHAVRKATCRELGSHSLDGSAQVKLLYPGFKGFTQRYGVKVSIPRHSETRYASVDLLALCFMEYRGFILLYLHQLRSLLTQLDLDTLKTLLDPEIQEIVRLRALLASRLLLPVMKIASQASNPTVYQTDLNIFTAQVESIASSPELLVSQRIAPKDDAVKDQIALIKQFLDNNSETRICLLDALLCLHDIPMEMMYQLWTSYFNSTVSKRAAKVIKENPTTKERNDEALTQVMEKAKLEQKKIDKRLKLTPAAQNQIGSS